MANIIYINTDNTDGAAVWEHLSLWSEYNAQTILAATNDDTPAPLTVGEQTLVGRLTGGNIAAVAIGVADDNIVQVDGTPVANNLAVWTASGLKSIAVTTVNAATYDLLVSDYILHVTYTGTGAVTSLTLPTAQVVAGRMVVIKDAGGNSATNNITIDTEGAETIDGNATYVIHEDYASINLYCDGSNWYVI